jgi:mannose-6-phosphate isomerase-like protein (cupin superfamily)
MNDNEVTIVRMFTGDDGETHFEDAVVPLGANAIGWDSGPIPGDGSTLRIVRPDRAAEFHCAPRRQFVIVLSGIMDIESGDGTIRRLEAGDVLLAEDTTGRGHRTNNSNTVRRILIVPVDEAFDLDAIRDRSAAS